MAELFENSRTSFYAGQSEDDALGIEGTYLYGEDVESKRFAKYIELAKAPQNAIDHVDTGGSIPRLGAEAPNPLGIDWIFFLCDDGKIVRDDGTLLYTESGSRDIRYHSFNVGDAYYFTTSGGFSNPMRLNKILHADIDTNWAGDVSEDILSGDPLELIASGFSGYHRFLVIGSIVYISSGNKIAKFNHNTGLIEAQFDFFDADIVGMTYGAGNVKVFLKNGLEYLWDGVNEEQPLDIIPLGEKLESSTSIGSIDYVVGGDLGGLSKFFYVNGRDLEEINSKQYSKLLGYNKFDVQTTGNFQNMDSADNQIFLVDRSDETPGQAYRVASYGNKINGLSPGYTVDVTKNTNGNLMSLLTFIFVATGRLYFGYSNGASDRGVDYVDLNQQTRPYISEGFVIDKLFDGGDIIAIKKEDKLYGKCVIPAGTSIEILQSTNGSDFVTCKTISDSSKLQNGLFTLSQSSFHAGTSYREVTYKIILRTTDDTKTPLWHGFKTKYSFTG